MSLLVGIDLGTTKTTAIAVDAQSGQLVSCATVNSGNSTASEADRAKGRSEWNAAHLIASGLSCLKQLGGQLKSRAPEVLSIGITGQQHGTVVVDAAYQPRTPFINWQDQRGNEIVPGSDHSWVHQARQRVGDSALERTGCRLNTGFLATTLFWMKANGLLPQSGTACFLMDLFVSELTGGTLTTEPTCAGSAGVLNVKARDWDRESIAALELPLSMFPRVREADVPAGRLLPEIASACGLTEGIPVSLGIGDHQASFLGSVPDRHSTVLINVGTGAQVAVFTTGTAFQPPIELRPFPISGNLLSNVGLTGGWQFQVLEQFFRRVGEEVFGLTVSSPLYATLTELAASVDAGAAGLTCIPTFSGTRANPDQRGTIQGLSPANFTPAHLARSVIEGMSRNYRDAWEQILAVAGRRQSLLVGAGNGLRENHVLTAAVQRDFGLEPQAARHREEAAFGAALLGAVSAGIFPDLDAAGSLVVTASIR